jgi:opacity protein-like surface antigen
MKTFFALAVLATAIASPALAQTSQRQSDTVVSGGKVLGSDPDANVRFDLLREQNWRNGGY